MADWDHNKPADNDLLSQYPQNERDARDAVRSNFGVDHRNTDDSDVGKHEMVQLLAQTTPTAASGQGHFYTKDTGSGQIELFHQDEAGNETQLTDRGLSAKPFESGTKVVFYQASAPTGWTQDTSVTDRVLRVVDGSGGGTGGSWTISGVTVDGHQLTEAEMPSHDHGNGSLSAGSNGSHAHLLPISSTSGSDGGVYYVGNLATGSNNTRLSSDSNGNHGHNISGSTSNAGSDSAHSHGLTADGNWRPEYIDVIVASKD